MSDIFRWLDFFVQLLISFGGAVAFFDALRRPIQAFEVVSRGSKVAWLAGLGIGTPLAFLFGILSLPGFIATIAIIVYHVDQKPRLTEVMQSRW